MFFHFRGLGNEKTFCDSIFKNLGNEKTLCGS